MIPAINVQSVLYNFAMYAFHDFATEAESIPLRKEAQDKVLNLLDSADSLTAEEATMLPRKQKKILYGMLTWYISFFSLPDWPSFPEGFLLGSSERGLSYPLLRYMRNNYVHIEDLLWSEGAPAGGLN